MNSTSRQQHLLLRVAASSNHVVDKSRRYFLITTDGQSYEASLVRADVANDLALLKVDGKFHALPIGNSRNVKRGQTVMTVGYPLSGINSAEPRVGKGIINSLSGIGNDPRLFQTDVPIQLGNSGSPLVDQDGYVVGIVSSKLSSLYLLKETGDLPQNVNYAIKANYLLELVSTLPEVEKRLSKKALGHGRSFTELAVIVERATALVLVVGEIPAAASPPKATDAVPERLIPSENVEFSILGGVTFVADSDGVKVYKVARSSRSSLKAGDVVLRCVGTAQERFIRRPRDVNGCGLRTELPNKGDQAYVFEIMRPLTDVTIASVIVAHQP